MVTKTEFEEQWHDAKNYSIRKITLIGGSSVFSDSYFIDTDELGIPITYDVELYQRGNTIARLNLRDIKGVD